MLQKTASTRGEAGRPDIIITSIPNIAIAMEDGALKCRPSVVQIEKRSN
jgi:hypothetical protein